MFASKGEIQKLGGRQKERGLLEDEGGFVNGRGENSRKHKKGAQRRGNR